MVEPRPVETTSDKDSLPKQEPEKSVSQDTSEIVKKGDVWRDGEWIVACAECAELNLSREEAINKATNEARMKAVAFEAGIILVSDTTIDQNEQRVLFDKYTNIKSRGKIVDEDGDPVIEIISTDMKDSRGLPVNIYRVTVRCKVEQEGEHDPMFAVTLDMDKALYKAGETMKFVIQSTQDCYITIFNVHGYDNKVHMLFPNDYDSDNFIFANTVTTIPSADSGIVFKAMLDEKQNRSSELIQVVATKNKVNFAEGWSKEAIFSFYPTPAAAGYTIGKILVNTPCEQWTETAKTLIIEQNNSH
ncbi:DUF4384 domain-containing protein [bacterium]|nr:DUF4384 domain-containing protein [bacterium]